MSKYFNFYKKTYPTIFFCAPNNERLTKGLPPKWKSMTRLNNRLASYNAIESAN